MRDDVEAGAAQHGGRAGRVGCPPVGRVGAVGMFDEMHLRIAGAVEMRLLPEVVIFGHGVHRVRAALEGLEEQQVVGDCVVNDVEGQ